MSKDLSFSTNNKCWQECGEWGTPLHRWWECRLVQPLWKAIWRCLRKLKMELPFDPAIPLLGIYPKKPKTLIWKNISTHMFIAVLFKVAKVWKQPKSINRWVDKTTMGHLHNGLLLSHERKKILLFATVQMELENIMLSEISQSEKDKIPYDFTHMWNLMNKLNQQGKRGQTHRWRADDS